MKKVKLGEICEVQAGGTPSRNKKEFWVQGNIPWVKIKDINSKYISKVEEHITELGLQFSSAKLFSRGTILYTIFATIGEVAILDIDAATNQAIAGLHLKSEKVLKEYLYFFLLSIRNRVKNDSRGVAQNNINLTYLKNIEVPIVENSIQQEICNNLTKINQIITLRNQQLIELSNLVKSRFNEMFGSKKFDKVSISELVDDRIETAKKIFDQHDTIKYIDISSIDNKNYKMTGFQEYMLDQAPSRAQQHIRKGDIVVSTVRPNLKNIAMTELDDENLVASSGFCVLRALKCLPEYLCAIICSDRFTNKMANIVTGANYPAIKSSDIMNYIVPLPPIQLQNEFADFVAQVDKSQLAIQKSLEELETLKKSLMQEYFG